jgi:Fe-S cluster assembly scaffold protein SufB
MKTSKKVRTIVRNVSISESVSVGADESLMYIFFTDQKEGKKTDVSQKILFRLKGRGARVHVLGFNVGGADFSNTELFFHHESPDTTGHCRIKSVMGGNAKSSVHGMICINKRASGANGYFVHNSLLLSRDAEVLTVPGLEIKTNDVKASHAATLSNLDPDTLFYLHSRGLSSDQAKALVITSFLNEFVCEIADKDTRMKVVRIIEKRITRLL